MRVPRSTRGLLALGIILVVGAVGVGVAGAMVVSTVLADTNVVRERIFHTDFTPSLDQPSFDSGWHIHPGVAIVQVQQGAFQVYQGSCTPRTVSAGDTFIEILYEPVRAVATGRIVWTTTLITNQGDLPLIPLAAYSPSNPNPCPGVG